MGFHKHGSYSFTIAVQKMSVIGGDAFVADLSGLRQHTSTGAAIALEVPVIAEAYGETAQDAEGRAIETVRRWLDANTRNLERLAS
jgi:hypothetical protein